MNPETDLIEKLNQPYIIQPDDCHASDLQPNHLVVNTNNINDSITTTLQQNLLNLDCGIALNGKEYTADDLVELLELKAILKQLHPEIFLVQ